MSLLDFPNEILFLVAKTLDARDLSSLHRTSSFLATLTGPLLKRILVEDKDGLPVLCWAAGKGYQGWCRLLLEKGHDVNAASAGAELTPLHLAAGSGHECVVELLLERGAAVDALDANGETPLHHAAKHCRSAAARVLLRHNADVDAANRDWDTPLLQAIGRLLGAGYPRWPSQLLGEEAAVSPAAQETAVVLLNSGADVFHRNTYGENALHQASSQGSLPVLDLVLDIGGPASVEVPGNHGNTALHIAVIFGQEEAVRRLLERNADIDATNADGNTPLHLAVEWRRERVLRILIEAECDAGVQNSMNYTALSVAAYLGFPEMVAGILSARPCFDSCCNAAALHVAVGRGETAIVGLLLDSGAHVAMDLQWPPRNQTVLQRAVQDGELEIAAALLRRGASVGIPDSDHRCALCAVLEKGSRAWTELFGCL